MASIDELLQKHSPKWHKAVSHPFLRSCADGTCPKEAFERWLVQDWLFVKEFPRLSGSLLAKAPFGHFDVLLDQFAADKAEIKWFQELAQELGVDLEGTKAAPSCQAYIRFMQEVAQKPYPVGLAALYFIERCYNQAWSGHQSADEPFKQCTERWASPEFSAWVKRLEGAADEALAAASQEERAEAESVLLRVCRLEAAFWEMAHAVKLEE